MTTISPLGLNRNGEIDTDPPSASEARAAVDDATMAVLCFVEEAATAEDDIAFRDVESELREMIFAFARAVIVLFLVRREETVTARYPAGERFKAWGQAFRRAPAIARNLTTMFGVVRYWRTYMREVTQGERRGFHPLDISLGLSADRFSWNVLAKAALLATKLSFAEARGTLSEFMPNAPSTEVIEKTVLGLGNYTEEWFQDRPAPDDDGEVLIIMVDGKGIPTATEQELRRRRGRRRRQKPQRSPRHRGRQKRRRHSKKPRRKKGDKSKNAKMATLVVMYTLRRQGTRRLEGPINKWVYGSFAPKRHTFEVARREADKRGFTEGSGKLVQVVTDGDPDLATYCEKYFPSAEHTVDIWHVVEYLWEAGACIFPEGSKELRRWVNTQKNRLFDGKVETILTELRRRLARIPKTGPGNKGRRERLEVDIRYISRRKRKMDYGSLRRRDLEISTGPIEGAVKHVIGLRLDHGGMRWIKERSEAILKLRCIEINGDWRLFEHYVHHRMHVAALIYNKRAAVQTNTPSPLPHEGKAA